MQEEYGMSRMQELLSSYYGMQDRESEEESMRNIDSQGFNSKTYAKEMLQNMGLNELLQRDDELIREIKELDTSMQMLVYENYNKFISATDTIRKMKNNVATMEEEVAKVVKSMDVITEKSESINVALAPHRSKVEKLIGVRRLLKRLEFIFELPQRLNTAVKQQEYANATKYYLLARRILGRYEHIASFKTIQLEAEKIMQQLEKLLSQRLVNGNSTSEEICETISLLHQLDACTDEMRQQFLDWHQTYFEAALAKYTTNKTKESVPTFLEHLNTDILTKMSNVFTVYKTNFLPDLVAREKQGGSAVRSSTAFGDDAFLMFAKEIFAQYLRVCSTQFRRPYQDFGTMDDLQYDGYGDIDIGSDAANEQYLVLMCVLKRFVAQVKDVDTIIPPCRFIRGAIEMVETCVRFQIQSIFHKLRQETIELLSNAHYQVNHPRQSSLTISQGGTNHHNVQPIAQQSAQTFTDMMQEVLRQMEPLVQTGATILREMSRLFSDLVQTQFYQFLKWFNVTVLMYTEPERAFAPPTAATDPDFAPDADAVDDNVALPWLEPTPSFLLFLACLCRELAMDGIGECLQVLISCLPSNDSSHLSAGSREGVESGASAQMDVTHMIEVTRESSTELLQHVAKHYGNQLCILINKGIDATSWTDMDEEPRSVQEMVVAVIEATLRFGKELALALGDQQSEFFPGSTSNSRTGSRDFRRRTSGLRSRGGVSGMQLDVERIFAKRIQVFHPITELTTDWFIQFMLKMAIKAFSEWIRIQELTNFALQQVQLNAEFLKATTVHLVSQSQEIDSLLSDLLSNARERSLEDGLMEQSNVVAIVSTRSTQVLSRRN